MKCRETIRRTMRRIHDTCRREVKRSGSGHLPFLWDCYKRHRAELLTALAALPLRSTSRHETVRRAVAAVLQNRGSRQPWIANGNGTDLSWIPAAWFPLVTGSNDRTAAPTRLDRHMLELCLLSRLSAEYQGTEDAFAAAEEQTVWDDASNMLATLHIPETKVEGAVIPPPPVSEQVPAFVS
jgi:hypothetical protein